MWCGTQKFANNKKAFEYAMNKNKVKVKCVIELRFYLQHKSVAAQMVTTVMLLNVQNSHCIVCASYNITTMDSA